MPKKPPPKKKSRQQKPTSSGPRKVSKPQATKAASRLQKPTRARASTTAKKRPVAAKTSPSFDRALKARGGVRPPDESAARRQPQFGRDREDGDSDAPQRSVPRASTVEQRARIESERETAIDELRRLGLSPDLDDGARGHTGQVVEDGDAAQASESRDMSFARRERLAARINALTEALERLARGDYGRCEECGGEIEPQRLHALPTARTCINCQQQRERIGGRSLSL
jgi:RNA polymerase-binding protein DksA